MRSASTRSIAINAASSGDNIILSAASAGSINIYEIYFTVAGATNITIKAGSRSLTGAIQLTGAGSSVNLLMSEEPHFTCRPGEAFIINSSNAVQLAGAMIYTGLP